MTDDYGQVGTKRDPHTSPVLQKLHNMRRLGVVHWPWVISVVDTNPSTVEPWLNKLNENQPKDEWHAPRTQSSRART